MQIQVLKSKIHNAFITEANVNYVDNVTIDEDLMNAVNLVERGTSSRYQSQKLGATDNLCYKG